MWYQLREEDKIVCGVPVVLWESEWLGQMWLLVPTGEVPVRNKEPDCCLAKKA